MTTNNDRKYQNTDLHLLTAPGEVDSTAGMQIFAAMLFPHEDKKRRLFPVRSIKDMDEAILLERLEWPTPSVNKKWKTLDTQTKQKIIQSVFEEDANRFSFSLEWPDAPSMAQYGKESMKLREAGFKAGLVFHVLLALSESDKSVSTEKAIWVLTSQYSVTKANCLEYSGTRDSAKSYLKRHFNQFRPCVHLWAAAIRARSYAKDMIPTKKQCISEAFSGNMSFVVLARKYQELGQSILNTKTGKTILTPPIFNIPGNFIPRYDIEMSSIFTTSFIMEALKDYRPEHSKESD